MSKKRKPLPSELNKTVEEKKYDGQTYEEVIENKVADDGVEEVHLTYNKLKVRGTKMVSFSHLGKKFDRIFKKKG